MADLVVKLRLDGTATGFVAATESGKKSVKGLGDAATRAGADSTRAFSASGAAAVNLSAELDRVKSAAVRVALTLGAGGGAVQFARSVVDASNAMIGFRSGLTAATGSANQSGQAIAFVRAESDRLGLSFRDSVGGFAQFAAATRGTTLEGQKTRDVFSAVAEAARTLNLSAETTRGALNALQQMVSKGTVAAEELRGQLGERLPGAFNLAAQAMGVTTAQLSKMLEQGQITADDLLPKLAARMHEVFGAQASAAAGSPAAEFERLKNALFDLQVAVGDAGFMQQLASGARSLAQALTGLTESGTIGTIGTGLVLLGQAALAAFGGRILSGIGEFAARQRDAVIATSINIDINRSLAQSSLATATAKAGELAGTLRVIEAARAEALAKQSLIAAEIRGAEVALATASATAQESFALKIQREATNELVAAKSRLAAITTDLGVLGRAQAGVQKSLAAATSAQAAAQLQANGAAAAGGVAMAGLRVAGSGLLRILGGWPGVVLLAAGALYKLWDAARAGEAAANAPLAALDALSDRLERQARLQGLIASGQANASNASEVDATAKAVARAVALQEALSVAIDRLDQLRSAPIIGKGTATAIGNQLTVVQRLGEQFDAAKGSVERYASALQKAGELTPTISAMVAEVDGLGESFRAASGPTTRFNANAFRDAAGVQSAASEFARLMTSASAQTADLDGKLNKVGKTAVDVARETAAAILTSAQSARLSDGQIAAARATGQALIAKAQAFAAAERAAESNGRTDNKLDAVQRTLADSMTVLADGADQLTAAMGDDLAKAEAAHIAALRKIVTEGGRAVAAASKLANSAALQAQVQAQVAKAIDAETAAYERNKAVLAAEADLRAAQLDPLESLLAGYQDEIDELSATGAAREQVIEQRQIEADVLQVVTALQEANLEALKNGTAQTKIDVEAIRRRIAAKREELSLERAQESLRSQGGSFGFLGGEDGKTVFSGNTFQELLGNSVKNAFSVRNTKGFFDGFSQAFKARVGEAGIDSAERIVNNIGGALNFVGGAIQAIKEEGLVGGLLTTAQQIPGIVGAVATGIKTAIGVFNGLFGKKPKLVLSGSAFAGSEATGETALGSVFLDNDRTKIDTQQILGAVQAFDQAIADAVSSFDGGSARIEAISARLVNFTSRLKGDDATPENLLKERFAAILGTFDGVIQAFVNKGIGLEAQVKRLTEILGAEQAFNDADLGIGFDTFVTIAEDMKKGGETIADTAQRIVGSVDVLGKLFDRAGVIMDTAGEAFIRLATEVSGVLGGLDKATALVSTFFETFFSQEENLRAAVASTDQARTDALAGLGLDAGISNADFRTAFEAALPTASPEEIAAWLKAGAAIRAASNAQEALNASYAEAEKANTAYREGVTDIADELLRSNLTEFGSEMRDINQWADNARKELNDLARAAGLSSASEEELAAVHQLAALKAGEAMRKLRERALDLVGQLQGTRIDDLNEQIALIEQANQSQLDGIDAVASAAADAANAQIDAQRRIRDFVDGILRNPALGGLRPKDALPIAQQQLQDVFAAAVNGDQSALEQFPALAEEILRLAQSVFPAGSDPFNAIRDGILAMGNQLAGQPLRPGAGVGSAGGGGGIPAPSGDLQQLLDERDALLAAQGAAARLALAQELSAAIRDLVIATGDPLDEIAASLGLSLTELVADLGVNLTDLSATTATELANIAQSMGVNLTDLASQVGVDLGDLSDAQSLLNDALEGTINGLPDAQRDALAPLLAQVEAAAASGDTAGVETGIDDMTALIDAMAPNIRDQLAPFFADIAPIDYTQLDALSFIDQSTKDLLIETRRTNDILVGGTVIKQPIPPSQTDTDTRDSSREIVDLGRDHGGTFTRLLQNLQASNAAQGFASFAVGTGNVPRTGLATIHQGEAILPTPVASFFRREGIPVNSGGDSQALIVELRRMLVELETANRKHDETARRIAELERTTGAGSRELVAATDRQTNTLRSLR